MRIEKLIIYGFGKHENVTIDLGRSMNVLYGHNEAGKTTIQQFILHVLFGFPQRNSALLRYEPKSGGKYGGQIHLADQQYGKCIVERVGGKSAGDVVVYFENGERGGEEALSNLLRQYNRASFESIFSFSLMELQGLEKMDEQTLSRTLLASGTTGVDDLLQIEKQMDKEMDLLFKRNGRNPALNKKLAELRSLEMKLQEEQKKAEYYAPAIEQIGNIEIKLSEYQNERKEFEEQIEKTNAIRQSLPLHLEKEKLAKRYKEIGSQSFPVNGIQRFETIKNRLSATEAAAASTRQQIAEIERQLENKVEHGKIEKLEHLAGKEAEWHQWLSADDSSKTDICQLEERKSRLLARLGMQAESEEEKLLQADVSIRKEEEMYRLLDEMNMSNQKVDAAESKILSLREEIGQIKEKEALLTPPSENDRQKAKDWPKIRQQLAEARAFVSFNQQKQNSSKMFGIAMLIIVLMIGAYGIAERQFSLLFISAIIAAGAFFIMKKQTNDGELQKRKQFIKTYEGIENEIETILSNVTSYEQQKQQLQEKLAAAKSDYSRVEQIYHEQTEENVNAEARLEAFLAQYGIVGMPSANIIPELFRMIREIQETIRQLESCRAEQQRVEKNIRQRIAESEHVLQQSLPRDALYELIRKAYHSHVKVVEQQHMHLAKKEELVKDVKESTALIQLLKEQIQELFSEANVKSEEAYYEADAIQKEKESLQLQIGNLDMQLAVNGDVAIDAGATDSRLAVKLAEMKKSIEKIDHHITSLLDEKAMLVNKTNQLLTDGTYAKLQQQFEIERAAYAELARKWAAKKVLSSAIRQMMNELKEKKFPHVLQKAVSYFERLTGGRYEAIIITEEGYFEVVSKKGMRFPIIELSQATKEQAYISLRLALAVSVIETAPFPIIMDDPFVNFDESRLSHIIELLEQFTEHQIIYFTCHEMMKESWRQATIINVSTIGSKQGADI